MALRHARLGQIVLAGNAAGGSKIAAISTVAGGNHCLPFALGNSYIEVSPVNAHVVARLLQHGLLRSSNAQQMKAVDFRARPDHWLVGAIGCNRSISVQIERNIMRFAVTGIHVPCHISDRARHDLHVVGKCRRKKLNSQLDLRALQSNYRAGCGDLTMDLVEGRNLAIRIAKVAIILSIDPYNAIQGLLISGPVLGRAIGKPIRRRPDTEVRVVHDNRSRRST